jgi:hypothetical protein
MTAQQLIGVVAAEYYREAGRGKREGLRPLMEIIERAHPGVVELAGSESHPGFSVKLAERPFPKKLESELRQAVENALGTGSTPHASPIPRPGLLRRIVDAIRRVFRG